MAEFRKLIQSKRRDTEPNPEIGCIILNEPFFWPEDRWIPAPESWSNNIVVGKTYETVDAVGRNIWQEVSTRLEGGGAWLPSGGEADKSFETSSAYGRQYLAKARLGQGMFRLLVEDAYQKRCAMTEEKTRPVLQAAHIRPFK